MARNVIIFFIMFLLQSVHTFAQEHGVKCRYLASHNITEDVLKMDDENIKKILIEKFSTDKKTYIFQEENIFLLLKRKRMLTI